MGTTDDTWRVTVDSSERCTAKRLTLRKRVVLPRLHGRPLTNSRPPTATTPALLGFFYVPTSCRYYMLNLLICYVYLLFALFCIHAVVAAVEAAIYEVTGYTYASAAHSVYTWVITNPVWAWKIQDALDPQSAAAPRRYF